MSTPQNHANHLTNVHADLDNMLETLQILSILNSSTTSNHLKTPNFHQFFVPHLPLLLTTRQSQAIYNLRIAYISAVHLFSSDDNTLPKRFVNFGRALFWALDHADTLLCSSGETVQIELSKVVKTIFQLIAGLCFREWGLDQTSTSPSSVTFPAEVVDVSQIDIVPSKQDPMYHPRERVRSTSPIQAPLLNIPEVSHIGNDMELAVPNRQQVQSDSLLNRSVNEVSYGTQGSSEPLWFEMPSDQITQGCDFTTNLQSDGDVQMSVESQFIRHNGKLIMTDACIREASSGCLVPFELVIHDNENGSDGMLDLFTWKARVLYPDIACLPYLPVQNVRILNCNTNTSIAEGDKFTSIASVEMNANVHETIINLEKEAYKRRFPNASHIFYNDWDRSIFEKRITLKVPLLRGAFARLVHLLWFVEHPLRQALEMCEHDVLGCGLFKVEFVETLLGTEIVLSLAGVIVERDLLNYSKKIFELLDHGTPTMF